MEYRIRPARKAECRRIAEFYRISSDGVADYIWSKLAAPDEDLLDVGQRRYEREDTPFSYRNCTVVDATGEALGMLVAFPMTVDPSDAETDPVLAPYRELEEDGSYYICGVTVDASCRGQGLGSRLMEDAERACRSLGLEKLSLIVFEQNAAAVRLYERLGYVERMRRAVVPHPLIRHAGDALLMVKELD